MPKKPAPASKTPRWDKLRLEIKAVLQADIDRNDLSSLRLVCREQSWEYQQVWLWFYSDKKPVPSAESLLSLLSYAFSKSNPQQQSNISSILKS